MVGYETFELGDVRLRTGQTLRDAKLAYKTYGTLDDDKSNAAVTAAQHAARSSCRRLTGVPGSR